MQNKFYRVYNIKRMNKEKEKRTQNENIFELSITKITSRLY